MNATGNRSGSCSRRKKRPMPASPVMNPGPYAWRPIAVFTPSSPIRSAAHARAVPTRPVSMSSSALPDSPWHWQPPFR